MSEYEWVYNRLKLSARFNPYLIQDLSRGAPERYPVYIRNIDTRIPYLEIAYCDTDLPKEDGYVAQKFVEGEKIQFDYTIKDSEIVERNTLMEREGVLSHIDYHSITMDMAAESFKLKNGRIAIETIADLIFRVSIK